MTSRTGAPGFRTEPEKGLTLSYSALLSPFKAQEAGISRALLHTSSIASLSSNRATKSDSGFRCLGPVQETGKWICISTFSLSRKLEPCSGAVVAKVVAPKVLTSTGRGDSGIIAGSASRLPPDEQYKLFSRAQSHDTRGPKL